MESRRLKSEIIWLVTRQQLAKLDQDDKVLVLPDSVLQPTAVVKNL